MDHEGWEVCWAGSIIAPDIALCQNKIKPVYTVALWFIIFRDDTVFKTGSHANVH